MAVDTPSKDYELTLPDRQLTGALRAGTRGMRDAGKVYLPQEPKETSGAYTNRLKRSVLTNFYRKIADMFSGKITRKNPVLLEETPAQILEIEDNIDNQGNSVAQFTEMALTHAVDDGVAFFFVDSPEAPATVNDEAEEAFPRTRAQDDSIGLRPYVRLIEANQLIGWKHQIENGKPVLIEIRILEWVTKPDPEDPFNDIEVEQIRQVFPNLHVLWQKVKDREGKEQWQVVGQISTDFDTIPLAALYTNKKKFLVGEPLFIDLANLNISHWQSDSDQSNIVHAIRMPILFGQGLSEAGEEVVIEIGPNSMVHGETGSDLKYVEHTGKSAEVGFKAIERLEENIVKLGAEIVMNKRPGNPTATARALDQAEADSEMATVSTNVEDVWRETFRFMAQAFGVSGADADDFDAGGVNMNKDFSLGLMDVSALKDLLSMRSSGDLSQQTLWSSFQRFGVLSEDFDQEAEEELLNMERDAADEREAAMMQTAKDIEDGEGFEGSSPDDTDDG